MSGFGFLKPAINGEIIMALYYDGQGELQTAVLEFKRCWSAQETKSPNNIQLAFHALALLGIGLDKALEDFAKRLPPAKK